MAGNKAWKAAAEVRHRWLAASLFPRASLPRRETQAFLASQLLTLADPLRSGLASAPAKDLFARLTGHQASDWAQSCDTTPAGRLTVMALAPVIVAYEHAMTDGEGRNTWRTDRYSPCPRREAAGYLAFLASIGYKLSDIEQAITDAVPYTGTTPADPGLTDHTDSPPAAETRPGSDQADDTATTDTDTDSSDTDSDGPTAAIAA